MPEMPPAPRTPEERRRRPNLRLAQPRPVPGRPALVSVIVLTVGLACGLAGAVVYASVRKDLTLVVAGQARQVLTFQRTVAQVLVEGGITLGPNDEVSPEGTSRLYDGQTVFVRRAIPVTIAVDGKRLQIQTAAATVADTLRKAGVTLGPLDKVQPSTESAPTPNTNIRVVRIASHLITEQIKIPYAVKATQDALLPRGFVRVQQEGHIGLKERRIRVTVADGVIVNREPLEERLVQTPLERIITVGTKVLVASRGEFTGHEYLDMLATAYSPYCCEGVRDRTAIGLSAGFGVVAVDPTVIPLGTLLYIEGYGQAIAGDTGGAIKGLRIDLGFATRGEALRFGVRTVRVYILSRKTRS